MLNEHHFIFSQKFTHIKAELAGVLQCWRNQSHKFHFSVVFATHFLAVPSSSVGVRFCTGEKINNAEHAECQQKD
jgi:hypothetical protein